MANRPMKLIREMEIQTTVRSPLTSVRMPFLKKIRDSGCWQGHREKGTLVAMSEGA